jgi:hypothetical protein
MSNHSAFVLLPMLCTALLAAACGGSVDGEGTGGGGSGTTGSTTSTGGSAGGLRTLDSCGTTIADDVPAFYRKYFRCVDISMSGSEIVFKTTDLPPHQTAYYADGDPNWIAFDTQGGTHVQNPSRLAEQALTMQIPVDPVAKGLTITPTLVDGQGGDSIDEYHAKPGGTPGVSLDGVAMFHGVAAPGDDLKKQEVSFDVYDGHPEMTGTYHYHGEAPGPLEVLKANGIVKTTEPGSAEVELYGIMCDGTLVLGCTELDGSTPDSADFDGQNGHEHDIAADGTVYFTKRYHTHVCRSKYTQDLFSPEIQYYVKCGG